MARVAPYLAKLQQTKKISPEEWAKWQAEADSLGLVFDDYLLEKGHSTEIEIAQAKADSFGLPFVDLSTMQIDAKTVSVMPQSVAEHNDVAVFGVDGKKIQLAIVDPGNYRAIEAVDFWANKNGYKVTLSVATMTALHAVVKKYKEFGAAVSEALDVIEKRDATESTSAIKRNVARKPLMEIVKKAPVATIVQEIISEASDSRASDIHIEPVEQECRIRFRIDGKLRTVASLPIDLHAQIVARIKVMANLKIDETRIPQDGRIRVDFGASKVDLRISTLPVLKDEKVVMRLLPVGSQIASLEELGFWHKSLEYVHRLIDRPVGVLLISGPTGSGKTTTLYSMLTRLNTEYSNIITLEDPVEYFLAGVNQVQVNPDVGLTFAAGLRSILRQDPNTIMVGEIRDGETASLAVQAALTGHFMLSTIHAKDVLGVIPRLMDMKVEPFLISSALNTISAQRLVRRICEDCKEELAITDAVKAELQKDLAGLPSQDILKELDVPTDFKFYHGKGCSKCNNTGYKGRLVIAEVLAMTDELRAMIRQDISTEAMMGEMKRQGLMTLKQDALLKAMKGWTTVEEVLMAMNE